MLAWSLLGAASLQLAPDLRHHSRQLTLLSRIDGDALRAKNQRWTFWIVREQALYKTLKPLI